MILTASLLWLGGLNVLAATTPVGPPWWVSLVIGVACTLVGIVRLKDANRAS